MIAAPAQESAARQTPIRAIVGENRERGVEPLVRREIPLGVLTALVLVALGAAIIAWWINRRHTLRRPAKERAFQRIARGLGLDRHERELVRALAGECDLEPLTLLVSPTAMRGVLERVDRGTYRQRRGWNKVAALGEAA